MMLYPFAWIAAGTAGALLTMSGLLHLLPRLGRWGPRASDAFCRAPLLDLLVTYFTIAPLIAGPLVGGWAGLAGAIFGQFAALVVWSLLHEAFHPQIRRHPRIISTLNRKVGALRNLTAVYWTAVVVPLFWLVRVAQVVVYPGLIWLVDFPRYRQSEWINVSRHKFQGLVGHDLIWCLYCDWMTGVWCLGTEMLRNVESFWCPIRFYDGKKCENCAIDFPDLNTHWIPADGTMGDVAATLQAMYPPQQSPNAWFGHRVRVTANRKPLVCSS
ncbi:MAG: hypothetical protein NZ561_03830 [Phycisphaerae bacterium]|nr:hypothetical protein [Phycisphaerae bacterium]MDW8261324.1 hypothetical protein [Phycisphaerales bacterium]